PLRIYTADGYLIKEFGDERRVVVKIDEVPIVLRNALLAAEDQHFYSHIGIDPTGIARAGLAGIRSGQFRQGASTITQQVARNFFLTRERSFKRKLYEALLALKIEQHLGKNQILELYINQIFLGQHAYGFAVASETYFGKPLAELTLAETALLAGLPQGPSIYNPIVNPVGAQKRQRYVLRRMLESGFIDETAYRQALDEPLRTASGSAARDPGLLDPVHAEYVADLARQIATGLLGEEALQHGTKIVTTITRAEQEAAYEALRRGGMDYDRRHGYRGPEKYLALPGGTLNPETLSDEIAQALDGDELHDYGDLLAAVVLNASPGEVTVYRNGQVVRIGGEGLRFAAPLLSANAPQARRVRRGAVVRIRNDGDKGWELAQMPEVDAALVSIDTGNGAVRALVGGFDYNRSQFNNVIQAQRQPGSSFKPFIYSASLERGIAPGTLVMDEPLDYPAGVTGRNAWTPQNYDGKFEGTMTVRHALARSKNIPAVRVLEEITPVYARGFITHFGFDAARHPPYLTMALGAGSVSPWEMAVAYAVFANGGYRVSPHVVKEIWDADNQLLARVDPPVAGESAPRVIDARNAWVMDSMLQDVVRRGTGARARALNRQDIAGKTGTTNDHVDAWFCGYTPRVAAVAWVGFPMPRNLGKGETGGTAALPIWIDYMRTALKGMPETFLPRPEGLASALAGDGSREDVYYVEFQPPELEEPQMEDDLFGDFFAPLTAGASRRAPPSPLPQIPRPPGQPPAPVDERPMLPIR
ncbi:MAG: PBP1A family penicillin-binding protein, partial [Azoarcus sp.]|nr:PBP1A family penicillin-binding protein [Azoarcus sp.]